MVNHSVVVDMVSTEGAGCLRSLYVDSYGHAFVLHMAGLFQNQPLWCAFVIVFA